MQCKLRAFIKILIQRSMPYLEAVFVIVINIIIDIFDIYCWSFKSQQGEEKLAEKKKEKKKKKIHINGFGNKTKCLNL